MYKIEGSTGDWEVVIGLEIHAQAISKSKLFSSASTNYGSEPNTQVSLIDAAFPGMLPVLNEFAIEQAVKTGIGLNAQINKFSQFDRKNYFYADLPQGYQISQFYYPIVGNGYLDIMVNDQVKRIGITRLHLEQDAGKSMHDQTPDSSLIDLNRAGIPLMEIVTEPDLRSPDEAGAFLKKIRCILRYLGTCDANMEQGNLRCDANISVRKFGDKLGTRCEIKNLNSIKNVVKAIEYEANRQVELLEDGYQIDQETRLFDTNNLETRTMRSKENAFDYRYFPDPDLLPINITDQYIENIKQKLPELPDQKISRYVNEFGLSDYEARVICEDKDVADFFDQVINRDNVKLATNWLIAEFFGRLNKAGIAIKESKVNSDNFLNLIDLIQQNIISGKIAKTVFDIMFETGKKALQIVEEQGLKQVTDHTEIAKIIDQVLIDNKNKVDDYKNGKDKLFGFFVGQVMKLSKGKANPKIVNDMLKEKLS